MALSDSTAAVDRIISMARAVRERDGKARLITRSDYLDAAEGTVILRQSERLTKISGNNWQDERGFLVHSEDLGYHDGYVLSAPGMNIAA